MYAYGQHTYKCIYCDLQNKWESRIFQRTFPVGFTTSKTFTAVLQLTFILQVAVRVYTYVCASVREMSVADRQILLYRYIPTCIVCMHTNICTYIYICTHIYVIYTYTCTNIYIYIYKCICIYIYIYNT